MYVFKNIFIHKNVIRDNNRKTHIHIQYIQNTVTCWWSILQWSKINWFCSAGAENSSFFEAAFVNL